jgi:hypothetical protein
MWPSLHGSAPRAAPHKPLSHARPCNKHTAVLPKAQPASLARLTEPRVCVLKCERGGGVHDVKLVPFKDSEVGVRPRNCMCTQGGARRQGA